MRTLRVVLRAVAATAVALGSLALPAGGASPTPQTSATPSGVFPPGPLLSAQGRASPSPVTITFGELGVGTKVTTQYESADGMVFESDGGGQAPFIATDDANPTSPSLSGVPQFLGEVDARFVNADGSPRTVDGFSVDVGYIDAFDNTTITAYDSSHSVIEAIPLENYGMVTASVTATGIASFSVSQSGEPSGFGIDNLTFPGVQPRQTYVAMGDSYSSGEGNRPFDPGTDTDTDACHRSPQAWPRLLSSEHAAYRLVRHLACSGAVTENITTDPRSSERPQIESLEALGETPDIITITIGGNDLRFKYVLIRCVVINCEGRLAKAESDIDTVLPTKLTGTLREIEAAAPGARVLLVGYPLLIPEAYRLGTRLRCPWLTKGEDRALVGVQRDLDTKEREIALSSGAEYVSVLDALQGHELCTGDPWVNTLVLTTLPFSYRGHPNGQGQQAIEMEVYAYLTQGA